MFCFNLINKPERTIIKVILQIITIPVLVGVVLYLSSFDLETSITIIALVFLVIAQIVFIMSRVRFKRPAETKRTRPIRLPDPIPKPAPNQNVVSKAPADSGINPDLFSKFQQNLNLSNQSRGQGQTKPNSDVILSISSKSKQPADIKKPVTARKEPPKESSARQPSNTSNLNEDIPVASLGSIFDDVQDTMVEPEERPNVIKPRTPTPPKMVLSDEKEEDTGEDSISYLDEEKEKRPDNAPIQSHEFLTSEDFAQTDQTQDDDTKFIMSIIDKQLAQKDYQACLSSINQYIKENTLKSLPLEQSIELLKTKADCEFEIKSYESSVKTWQALFKNFITTDHEDFISITESLAEKFREADQPHYEVHFLFSVLNEYRKQQNFSRMDVVYGEIEAAYEQMADWGRLIQTYENHLSIKRSLNDLDGQLDILDQLGKRLYDQGDAEGSRKCYEQRLAIENQLSSR